MCQNGLHLLNQSRCRTSPHFGVHAKTLTLETRNIGCLKTGERAVWLTCRQPCRGIFDLNSLQMSKKRVSNLEGSVEFDSYRGRTGLRKLCVSLDPVRRRLGQRCHASRPCNASNKRHRVTVSKRHQSVSLRRSDKGSLTKVAMSAGDGGRSIAELRFFQSANDTVSHASPWLIGGTFVDNNLRSQMQ